MTLQTDPSYLFDSSSDEYGRLTRQAALIAPMTERLFRDAGITPGMRVLDVGSGVGDVALLAGRLVGPHGSVVGVDIDGSALQTARARAGRLGLQNLTFIEADVRSADTGTHFDAAVGRLVLGYLADPAEALRAIAERVRPGGIVAFQELDLDPAVPSRSFPEGTLWDQTGRLVVETFTRAGTQGAYGAAASRLLPRGRTAGACHARGGDSGRRPRLRRVRLAGRRRPRPRPGDGKSRNRWRTTARP